ncbi:hypothetical protein [Bradyrhizobium liaoningense]|uniref:hypothetical protein n=1 Tax=Bradyrhizobium liaoningense TaxID=43992 RepID=UPI001BA788E2|nr:hypothetical protein [Bradyrhizobium liaoningense]MBR0718929.1 hypothetical protein [Bradyrhizobium liaoningense]
MRIREENCNMVLLAAVTLSCIVAAGAAALVGPATRPAPQAVADNRITDTAPSVQPVNVVDRSDVRVVGTPFVPNVNPRER